MVKLNYFSRVLNYLNAFKKVSLDLRGYKICEKQKFFFIRLFDLEIYI